MAITPLDEANARFHLHFASLIPGCFAEKEILTSLADGDIKRITNHNTKE